MAKLRLLKTGHGDLCLAEWDKERPETVAQMGQNHIGNLQLGIMKTAMPELSNDVDLFPGVRCGHGLASVVNAQQGPDGRSAGTVPGAGGSPSWPS